VLDLLAGFAEFVALVHKALVVCHLRHTSIAEIANVVNHKYIVRTLLCTSLRAKTTKKYERQKPDQELAACRVQRLLPGSDNPDVIAHGYFGTVDRDSEDGMLRPASVYSPKKRMVAIALKETGTHIPFSSANCIVR
jgi:hypothetical protein